MLFNCLFVKYSNSINKIAAMVLLLAINRCCNGIIQQQKSIYNIFRGGSYKKSFHSSTTYLFQSIINSNNNNNNNVIECEFNNVLCGDMFLVPMFTDNYGLLLIDRKSRQVACVDPGDGEKIVKALEVMNIPNLDMILCTHKHNDHIGGIPLLKKRFPSIKVIATKYETVTTTTQTIEADTLVANGDRFKLGSLDIEVFHTPCHTKGHVIYLVTNNNNNNNDNNSNNNNEKNNNNSNNDDNNNNNPILFTGDTLFVGGCGRFFEGTATEMVKNMDLISLFHPNTFVFCAHEYTESNLKFLSSVDPDNCKQIYENVKNKRSLNKPTVPTQLKTELEYNLFMKCNDKKTQIITKTNNAVSAMGVLRKMKNDFK